MTWEEPGVDEGDEVWAGDGGVVVERAGLGFGGGPGGPAVGWIDDEAGFDAVQLRLQGAFAFQVVQVFEEEHPGGLFGVVQLCGAAGFLAQDVVYGAEGLFEH